jgi:predicted nucleotide-binding protein (sugar kinase/HSP70/actin superfamily)
MAIKIGIPRSLFYYRLFPLWESFFEELGAELVVSDITSRKILDDGVKSCVDEACLPVKLFHGHVINIKDKVDYLFIPRLTSISRDEYICPKFGGLPDMVRHTLKGLPQIIDTEINLRRSGSNALKSAMKIGAFISKDKKLIKKAYKKAIVSYKNFEQEVKKGVLPGDILDKKRTLQLVKPGEKLNIGIIGHPYNLYDSYMNMGLLKKLKDEGVNIISLEMIDDNVINKNSSLLPKKIFWNFGRKAIGSVMHFLDRDDIDGIIYVMSFGCGVDSFVCDLTERKIRRKGNVPFTVLTIDEHSGEAGMDTRLEAFIDMIRWRKKNENNLSAHG